MSEQKDADKIYEAVQKLTRAVLLCTGAIIARRYSDEEIYEFSSREPFYFGHEKFESSAESAIEKWAREQHENINNFEILDEEE